MVDISIRVDDTVKKQAEAARRPFYSKENQEHLDKVISNYYDGKAQLVSKEISDLEEMEE